MPHSSCLEFAQQLSLNPCSLKALAIKELVGPRTLATRPAPSIHLTTVTQGAAPAAEQAIGPPRPNFHIEILMPMIK